MRHIRVSLLGLLVLTLASTVSSQIFLKPSGEKFARLTPKALQTSIVVEKQIAKSHVEYLFSNDSWNRIEAEFVYTVPENAVVTGFAYWYGKERVVARVAEKERAATIYKGIVARESDPALIELVGKRTFRARIFPVMPDADLKIEIDLVQVLPGTGSTSTLTVPIKMEKGTKLDQISADILVKNDPDIQSVKENVGVGVSRSSDGWRIHYSGSKARPTDDLRVTSNYEDKSARMEFYSARSGGQGGYFSLVINSSKPYDNPKLVCSKGNIRNLHVNTPKTIQPGTSWLVTGEYIKPESIQFSLKGKDHVALVKSFECTSQSLPNHFAMKLWANEEISKLGNNAKAVTALSLRHTLPSKFTSWIAIPVDERKRYEETVLMQKANVLAAQHAELISRGQKNSARARLVKSQLDVVSAKVRKTATEYSAEGAYYNALYSCAGRYAQAIAKKKENDVQARRDYQAIKVLAEYVHYSAKEVISSELYRYAGDVARIYGEALATEGFEPSKLKSVESEVTRLRKYLDSNDRIDDEIRYGSQAALARQIVTAAEKGDESKQLRLSLRIIALDKLGHGESMGEIRNAAYERLYAEKNLFSRQELLDPNALQMPAWMVRVGRAGDISSREIVEYRRLQAVRQEIQNLYKRISENQDSEAGLGNAKNYLHDLSKNNDLMVLTCSLIANKLSIYGPYGQEQTLNLPDILSKLDVEAPKYGFTGKEAMQYAFQYFIVENVSTLDASYVNAQRKEYSKSFLKRFSAVVGVPYEELLKTRYPTEGYWHQAFDSDSYRKDILAKFAEGAKPSDIPDLTRQFAKEPRNIWLDKPKYTDWRVERLYVQTLLDKLEKQPRTAEVEAEIKRLSDRRTQLVAKMGDPLISITLPKDTLSAIAIMPWGEVRPLQTLSNSGTWQGRFDIPAGVTDGQKTICIVAISAYGVPTITQVLFTVDNQPPKLEMNHQRVVANETLSRLKWVSTGESVVELKASSDGSYLLSQGFGELIAIDKAHNVSRYRIVGEQLIEIEHKPNVVPTVDADWETQLGGINVQSISQTKSGLIIGTLDGGLSLEDKPSAPLGSLIPRTVLSTMRGTYMRTADSGLYELKNDTWEPLAVPNKQQALSICSDGRYLFVQSYGSSSVYDGKQWVTRPNMPEVAGFSPSGMWTAGNQIFAGFQGKGVTETSVSSGKTMIFTEAEGLTDDWITGFEWSRNRLYAGTFGGGLLVFENGSWREVEGTEGQSVTSLCDTSDGLFFGTRTGLYHLVDAKVVKVKCPETPQSLCIRLNQLWLGGRNGLYRMDVTH